MTGAGRGGVNGEGKGVPGSQGAGVQSPVERSALGEGMFPDLGQQGLETVSPAFLEPSICPSPRKVN